MSNNIPKGDFEDGHLVWEQGGRWIISRGYDLTVPDLSTHDDERWLAMNGCLRRMLCCLGPDERLQVVFYTGNDFNTEFDTYDANSTDAPKICKEVRQELSRYFRDRMASGTLIRSTVRFYLLKSVKATRKSAFEEIFTVVKRSFNQRENYFDVTLRAMGGSAKALDDQGHYEDLLRFWSPGQTPASPDFSESVDTLCRYSDISPRMETEHGFFLNGHYTGLYVAKLMPRMTWEKSMEPIFNLCIPGLRVTLNVFPLSVTKELAIEDKKDARLAKNVQSPSIAAGRLKHFERAVELHKSHSLPFRSQVIFTLYDRDKNKLDDRMEALRSSLDSVGFLSFRPSLPVSCVGFFNCSIPGFGAFVDRKDFWNKIDDNPLAHLIPACSTPTAQLPEADWVSCSNRNNPIGGKLFAGSQPLDTICIGTKGSGKSVLMQTVLLQAAGSKQSEFKFIAVVDNGSSWIETCRLLDPTCKPIIVRSRSGHTFNLFDTRGLALSAEHLRSAGALAELLVGQSKDEDRQSDRSDILANTIRGIYEREYRYWRNKYPGQNYIACRRTLLALKQLGKDFVDAVQWLKELDPDKLAELDATITEDEAVAIEKDKNLSHFVQEYAFSTWTPEMFPTLYDLWEELHSKSHSKNASPYCEGLANRLRRWLSDGEYGPLVDGVSNVDLGSSYVTRESPLKVVYFELGAMKESEEELRNVIGFLITTELRNVIQTMPRAVKKAFIIEELTSFMRIPNAPKIIMDFSERLRKYQCWFACIFQQYYSLLKADPAVAEALIGNAQTLFLLRNINRTELDGLDAHIRIPEPIKDALQTFPMPETLRGKPEQSAGFVYVQRSDSGPVFTIGSNVISNRLEEIVSSSGDSFEAKMKRLAA